MKPTTHAIATMLLVVAMLVGAAYGQPQPTPNGPADPPTVQQIIDAANIREVVGIIGTSYNHTGSPKLALTIGGAYQVNTTDYVALMADVSWRRSQNAGTNPLMGVSLRPEYVRYLVDVGGVSIFALAGIGAEFQSSDPSAVIAQLKAIVTNVGTNVGYNAATGLVANIPIGKRFVVPVSARYIKGSLNDAQIVIGLDLAGKIPIGKRKTP